MRVLFDHQIFSYQAYGGASRYYAELMAAFARAGEPAFELGVAESPNEYLARADYYRGKRVAKGGTAAFLRTYARNAIATHLAARRDHHDVLHATFYDPGVLRDVRGGKLVVTILDMIPEHFPELYPANGWYARLITRRWIEGKRTLCERADTILAISEHTKRDVVAFYGIDPARITVTHLATSIAPGDGPRPAGTPARYVLFVGLRGLYKNFAVVAEALAPLCAADRELGLVCIGGGAFTAEETALLERHGIAERTVQRNAGDDELAAYYAHAAAFVFPSRYEGFGIPVLEAFACGCPVLLANASCFPEIAGDAARYFEPGDAAALTALLREVLGSQAAADALRAKGKARVRAFTWDQTAAQTVAAYRHALGARAQAVAS